MTKTKTDPVESIKSLTEKLLELMSIVGVVKVSKDQEETIHVDIDTQDAGLLIGHHGETINSLQVILGAMAFCLLGKKLPLVVNVGDYRQKREEVVKNLALQVAREVAKTGKPSTLSYLVPFERRIVHLTLADHPQVVSASEGEGKDRRVVVKPKVGI